MNNGTERNRMKWSEMECGSICMICIRFFFVPRTGKIEVVSMFSIYRYIWIFFYRRIYLVKNMCMCVCLWRWINKNWYTKIYGSVRLIHNSHAKMKTIWFCVFFLCFSFFFWIHQPRCVQTLRVFHFSLFI